MIRSFTDHPASVGETYLEHAGVASAVGWRLIKAGMACLVHALLPCFFSTTASDTIADLHARMQARRRLRATAEASEALGAAPLP